MLRVGLTGELGSGKSTVARLLAAHGAVVLSSDEIGRAMMQPGEAVYQAIVDHFGPSVVLPDGHLNRPELARIAFAGGQPRVEELNAIVHPAVIAEQERLLSRLAETAPDAIAVIESALIFTTKHAGAGEPWRKRFDRIILVTAPDTLKLERFLRRTTDATASEPEQGQRRRDAEARLAAQQRISTPPEEGLLTLRNDGSQEQLQDKVERLWSQLVAAAGRPDSV